MKETTVEQFQALVDEWDKQDWIQAFSIVSGLPATDIAQSDDGELEGSLYRVIEYLFNQDEWEALNSIKIPKEISFKTVHKKDQEPRTWSVLLNGKVGKLKIEQSIQARKWLEGTTDIRSRLSMVTAIYLQPLIDNGPFEVARAIEVEKDLLKMSIHDVYPIGFFLRSRLKRSGNGSQRIWSRTKEWLMNWIRT